MNITYYFPNTGKDADQIFGDQYPVCLPASEISRLSMEWGCDVFDQVHEASAAEIAEHGIYDDMDADLMKAGVRDWLQVHDYGEGGEYDDLKIDWDSASYDEDLCRWTMSARDADHVYTFVNYDGRIELEY